MHKLMGLLVLALAFTVGLGTVGCKKDEKKDKDKKPAAEVDKTKPPATTDADKTKPPKEKDEPKTAEITKVVPGKEVVEITLKKDADVTAEIPVTVEGKDWTDKVMVKGETDAKGLKIESAEIAKDKKEATLKVTAAKDAAVGDHKVTITASGGGAKTPSMTTVTVKVKAP